MLVVTLCSHEAMSDLIALMSQLVDNKGKLLVPGIYDTVAKLTPEEEKLYDAIDFDMVMIYSDRTGTGTVVRTGPGPI